MTPFAQHLLALLIQATAPNIGHSPYSFELVPACGSAEGKPDCKLEPVCDEDAFWCRAPRFSPARGGWVRVETREAALRRYQGIAESLARTSFMLTRCHLPGEAVSEDCEPAPWPEGPESLALAAATTAVWESGLREDIESGYGPVGRGKSGEACLTQVMPDQIAGAATWLAKSERTRPRTREEIESLAAEILGSDPASLDRCFTVGMMLLARARQSCKGGKGDWPFKMWSRYGTGFTCNAYGIADDFAGKRARTFNKFRLSKEKLSPEVRELLGISDAVSDRRVGMLP